MLLFISKMSDKSLLAELLRVQKQLLEKQDDIIQRLDRLEKAVFTSRSGVKGDDNAVKRPSVVSEELDKKIRNLLSEKSFIIRKNMAKEVISELSQIEKSYSENISNTDRKILQDYHTAVLNLLATVGIDVTQLPIDIFTQAEIFSQIDREIERLKNTAGRTTDPENAKVIIQNLKELADTLNYNKSRFSSKQGIEKRVKEIITLMRSLARKYDIVIYYYPDERRKRRVSTRKIPSRGKISGYVSTKYLERFEQEIDTMIRLIESGSRRKKDILLADLEDIKDRLSLAQCQLPKRVRNKISHLEYLIEKLPDSDISGI